MPAVKKGTTPGAAPELMSDFVLDDEATEVSQPDTAPSFAVGGGGGGGGGASAAGGAQAIMVRSIAVKYIPSFIDGQGVVVVYNMMLWHWGKKIFIQTKAYFSRLT